MKKVDFACRSNGHLFDSKIWQMNENIKKQNINEDEKV